MASVTAQEKCIFAEKIQSQEYFIQQEVPNQRLLYMFLKRIFDITASLLAGIVLFIPMLIIVAAIRLDSKGPAIFKQERLGKDGKPFMMYKFRSMYMDAEKNGPQWAAEGDRRCTRVGCFLRKSRLDELPQLWNIFKGEMSIVGPRPEGR